MLVGEVNNVQWHRGKGRVGVVRSTSICGHNAQVRPISTVRGQCIHCAKVECTESGMKKVLERSVDRAMSSWLPAVERL